MRVKFLTAALLAVALLPSPTAQAADTFSGNTKTALASLTIADESRAGYDRDLFKHWIDVDGDRCNARYEVLIAEAVKRPRIGNGCSLSGGRWVSAYDGVQTTQTNALDIDHVVPLAEAWDSGANTWSATTRQAFANDLDDPRSLIAVTARSNRQKSDQDPAEWLPTRGRCTYVVNWIAVKVRWQLSVDPIEHAALSALIDECGLTSLRVRIATITYGDTPAPVPAEGTVNEPVKPGAFCAPRGAVGYSTKGVEYTCKPSDTETRNRWRR